MIIPISLGCCRELAEMVGVVVLCYVLGAGYLKLYFLMLMLQARSPCISTSFPLLVLLPAFSTLNILCGLDGPAGCVLSRTSLLIMKFYSFIEGFKDIFKTLFRTVFFMVWSINSEGLKSFQGVHKVKFISIILRYYLTVSGS